MSVRSIPFMEVADRESGSLELVRKALGMPRLTPVSRIGDLPNPESVITDLRRAFNLRATPDWRVSDVIQQVMKWN